MFLTVIRVKMCAYLHSFHGCILFYYVTLLYPLLCGETFGLFPVSSPNFQKCGCECFWTSLLDTHVRISPGYLLGLMVLVGCGLYRSSTSLDNMKLYQFIFEVLKNFILYTKCWYCFCIRQLCQMIHLKKFSQSNLMRPMSFVYWQKLQGHILRPVSGSDCASLSRPGKSKNPGRIVSDGSGRAAGDPCCRLGFNKAEIVPIYNLTSNL